MNWFDILKYEKVEPHDIVPRRNSLLRLIEKISEYSNNYVKPAHELRWSLIEAAFFNKPIPTKMRILLRRLIPYTEINNQGRIFNTVSTAGNRGIRKLPFDLEDGTVGLTGDSSKGFRRRLEVKFVMYISEEEVIFALNNLQINDWYTTKEKEITRDTAEFIRIWKYMQGYSDILINFDIFWSGQQAHQIMPSHAIYYTLGLSPEFATSRGNVSKEDLDKFISNVRKYYNSRFAKKRD